MRPSIFRFTVGFCLLWICACCDSGPDGGAPAPPSGEDVVVGTDVQPGEGGDTSDLHSADVATDDGGPPADVPPGAGDDARSGCVCFDDGACCDGCTPRRAGLRCVAGGDGVGVCVEGECRSVGAVREWLGHAADAWPQSLALSPDGRWLASGAAARSDGEARGEAVVWNRASGDVEARFAGATDGVAFSPDGLRLALGQDHRVALIATDDWSEMLVLNDLFGPVAFSPDGAWLAAGVAEGVALVDMHEESVVRILEQADDGARLWQMVFSPDGTRLVTATGQHGMGSPRGGVRVWDVAAGTVLHHMECPALSVAFAPDGERLAAACWNSVGVWDAATGALLHELVTADAAIGVAFSPDGAHFAVGTLFRGVSRLAADHPVYPVLSPFLPLPGARALLFDSAASLTVGAWEDPVIVTWTP